LTQFSATQRHAPPRGDGIVMRLILAVAWAGYRVVSTLVELFARPITAMAVGVYRMAAPIVSRFPGMILIGAVVAACVGVWVHALVFAYVDKVIIVPAAAAGLEAGAWGLTPTEIETLISQDAGVLASASSVLKYLFWPIQFSVVRDLLILGGLFGFFNVVPVYTIWWERKVAGRIQSRLGPMRVGGWHGWAQSFADGVKLVLKEDLIPDDADKPLYRAAPYFAIIPSLLAFVALPFGLTYAFRELDVALVFILAMLGIEVLGVIMAGWASNNKWSVYGAMREACQMVAYEIPMGMALLVPVVTVGSLSLQKIGDDQSAGWFDWMLFRNPFTFVAFVSYFIASLASCKRAPFDLPESESELVAGFHTEYSGFRWALFFFAEYAAMFVVAGLATILFVGGWHSPLPVAWHAGLVSWLGIDANGLMAKAIGGVVFSGPVWFVLKCVFFLYCQLWIRWTLPRIRIDQVLYACVQVLLPITMVVLLGATAWVLLVDAGGSFVVFSNVVRVVLGIVGLLVSLMFPAIAMYGFYHRRRLVGRLVVDARPGS
jgi:NADH-quinone oxidoreductase subunit H